MLVNCCLRRTLPWVLTYRGLGAALRPPKWILSDLHDAVTAHSSPDVIVSTMPLQSASAKQCIGSLLDNDLYKFVMQQAVLQLYPATVVRYQFKNRSRTTHRYTKEAFHALNQRIDGER